MKNMRLTNISVDEVSLVDKAANKRKFAFLKRDEVSEIIKEEVKETEKIIEEVKTEQEELTPEELEQFKKLHNEIIELAALVKQN